MKLRKTAVLSAAALLLAAAGMNVAEARPGFHGGFHGGFHSGGRVFLGAAIGAAALASYYYSPYYYPPAYYPPAYYPPAYYPPAQPTYIEQPQYAVPPQSQYSVPPQPQAQSEAYWYYCPATRAYYPHVQSCAAGWQRVAPQPPPR
ncbi:MAG TPA: hypothetical protein VIF38_10410 [Burkholderiales bacterium]